MNINVSHKLDILIETHIALYYCFSDTVLFKDKKNNYIYSYNLQTREAPVPVIEYGLGPISSMEYDNYGNNLYWCDENKLTVEAYSFTTFSRTIIISGNNSETPHSIALVPDQGLVIVVIFKKRQ